MSDTDTAVERITTVEDGPGTVNESLSLGGPGPDGQTDTVIERLSGAAAPRPEPDAAEDVEATPKAKKKS